MNAPPQKWDGPFRGVFAAALTAVSENGALDMPRTARHAQWLLANGCDGLGVLGTTGEANSFSVSERMAYLDGLIAAGAPAEKLMPGTGVCAVPETAALTRHAVQAGAPGVLMLPPFYYKGADDDGLITAYARVIDAVNDNRLRVYLYHFPQMSGVPVTQGVIAGLRKRFPEIVVGMKDSSGDLENMAGAAENFPGFAVFAGSEAAFYDLLGRGGAGCITAVSNITAPLAQIVWRTWAETGAEAAENKTLKAVRTAVAAHPLFAALKALQARHTGDPAWEHLRPPLTPLGADARRALFNAVDAAGYKIPDAA
ncbi:MAG: dihydrodipicolinate synthase family protein [Rhodospirillales bacterium]